MILRVLYLRVLVFLFCFIAKNVNPFNTTIIIFTFIVLFDVRIVIFKLNDAGYNSQ